MISIKNYNTFYYCIFCDHLQVLVQVSDLQPGSATAEGCAYLALTQLFENPMIPIGMYKCVDIEIKNHSEFFIFRSISLLNKTVILSKTEINHIANVKLYINGESLRSRYR